MTDEMQRLLYNRNKGKPVGDNMHQPGPVKEYLINSGYRGEVQSGVTTSIQEARRLQKGKRKEKNYAIQEQRRKYIGGILDNLGLTWRPRTTDQEEFKFDPGRNWKADVAVFRGDDCFAIIEIHGGTRSKGRHNRALGLANDCEKMNAAQLAGIIAIAFTDLHFEKPGYITVTLEKLAKWA